MPKNVITLSRQAGSPGDAIGYELARTLNYTCINKSFVDLIARKARVAPWQVDRIERHGLEQKQPGEEARKVASDEPEGRSLEALIRHLGYGERMTGEEYIQALRAVMQDLASIGHVVIIGRGGQVLLRHDPATFHVRVLAPRDQRIAELQREGHVSWESAAEMVHYIDGLRAELLREIGCDNIDDPALYDLVLETAGKSVPQCVEEIIAKLEEQSA